MADAANATRCADTAVRLPHPALRACVARYAGFRGFAAGPSAFRVPPSRYVTLIVSLAAPIRVSQIPDASIAHAHQVLVGGLRDAPIIVSGDTGAMGGLHLFLKPLGVRALLGVPSSALMGRIVDLSDILGARAGSLTDRLHGAVGWEERFGILDECLLQGLTNGAVDPLLDWAWRRLASAHGMASVAALSEQSGWSRRHFGERFRSELGLSPKTISRILRFERASWLIRLGRSTLAGVAAEAGYSDQAHMTREWAALAARTPRDWIRKELPFLQDYEMAGSENGPSAADGAQAWEMRSRYGPSWSMTTPTQRWNGWRTLSASRRG